LIKFFPIKRQERDRGREGDAARARVTEQSGVGVFVEENINMGFIILWRSSGRSASRRVLIYRHGS